MKRSNVPLPVTYDILAALGQESSSQPLIYCQIPLKSETKREMLSALTKVCMNTIEYHFGLANGPRSFFKN